MERRVLIAVLLSFLVLYGYQALFPPRLIREAKTWQVQHERQRGGADAEVADEFTASGMHGHVCTPRSSATQ